MTASAQPAVRPLLPAAGRRPAWVLVACCAIVVAALPALFARRGGLDWLDRSADRQIMGFYRAHHDLLLWLALPGDPIPAAALIAIIAVTCLVTGRVNGAVLTVVAIPGGDALTEHVLKPLAGRTTLGFASYPSGHATTTFGLAAVLAVLMLNPPGRPLKPVPRLLIPAVAVALACVVSTAVIGLGWHYLTDTIAGAAVGIGTVAATALVLDLPGPRRWLPVTRGHMRKPRPGWRHEAAPGGQPEQAAEADGNRTRRRRGAPSTGFEDRGGHQAP